jgi:periplasmic divalent cation tolerance protein
MRPLLVVTNAPDRDVAEKIARRLIESRLAACVNILGECRSVYRWKGAVEAATEVPLLIKTQEARYAEVERAIRALHPYELPEIVAVSMDRGLTAYLEWVAEESTPVAPAAPDR